MKYEGKTNDRIEYKVWQSKNDLLGCVVISIVSIQ